MDLGERWIGIAGTDDTGVLASPIETLDLRRATLASVARIASEQAVSAIVVGLPRTMSGTEGFQARKARDQATELQGLTDIPIIFWDERLTTAMAEQIAARRKRRRSAKAEPPDALAAAVLLQGYLDANPYRSRSGQSR
ncbi:MAG: Holliday junction resolvase RuvX [Thermomicrobiales bacterium]